MAVESRQCWRCKLGIKGRPNRSTIEERLTYFLRLMNFGNLAVITASRIFPADGENFGGSGYSTAARKSRTKCQSVEMQDMILQNTKIML